MNELNPNLVPIALIILAALAFFKGLKTAKLVRRMADTPLSKIGSAAIGQHVEIKGQIVCKEEEKITSPLTNNTGVAYFWDFQKWEITKQERIKNGLVERESGHWKTLFYYYSRPFLYVTDESQAVAAIDLPACEFHQNVFDSDFEFDHNLPDFVEEIFESNYSGKYRIREKVWSLNETLYVHGTAFSAPSSEFTRSKNKSIKMGKIKSKVIETINSTFDKLKERQDIIERFDSNKDGAVDNVELTKLKKAVEKKVIEKNVESKESSYLAKAKIFFSLSDGPKEIMSLEKVYLSTIPEEKILPKLKFKAYGAQLLGAIMFAYGAYLLASQ